jgi:hypothetical protein
MSKIFIIPIILFFYLTSRAQSNDPCPCCAATYRQFDFWIGDWETLVEGKKAGKNRIIVLQDSCLIQENWTGAGGNYTGTSYNYYDPQDKSWHQTWIDSQGKSLRLTGNLLGQNMVLMSGPMTTANGDTVLHRITWTPNPDGTVRQHWQSNKSGGDDWQTLFDGLYRKQD